MAPTMDYARNMFDAMPEREVFLWNTLIRGNADRGACHEAIVLHRKISLVSMYAKNGETLNSELVFNAMVVKNIVSWTAMTAGYVKNGFYKEGLSLLQDMIASGSQPNVGYTGQHPPYLC
ncbi:putative pentatricopeptide [Rosa chinensis]|uniref:Putative pentatricopeptide n=1 Tax=Rosa chinensis TaxID=74649 RepID=A0A2P6QG87_ROSCH|nr:putative pentatricopeptide [Rosa chinensis]